MENSQYFAQTNEFSYESVDVAELCFTDEIGTPFLDSTFDFPVISFNISRVVDVIKLERPDGVLTYCDLRFTYKYIQGCLLG